MNRLDEASDTTDTKRLATALAVAFVLPGFALSVLARVDENTLRARVLYLGDSSFPANKLVLQWIMAEPKFSLAIVPCDTYFISLADAKKFTRLYLPRSYEALNGSFDLVVLHDISPTVLPEKILGYIQCGVAEDGLGLGLISYMFWRAGAGTNDIEIWMAIAFYETFPADVDVSADYPSTQGRTYWRVVRQQPILGLPGIENQPMRGLGNHGGDIWPRPGSVVHAVWRGSRTPVLVTGTYGSGATLQLAEGWHNPASSVFDNYRYMPDLIYNQLYFLAKVKPPEDLDLAHGARDMFMRFSLRKLATLATMEFVDRFGGKLDSVEKQLSALDLRVAEAGRSYLQGDFAETSEMLDAALVSLASIEEHLARIKKSAIGWISASEWLAVSSTSILCGVSLWWLMVRRSAYRPVETTKLSAPSSR